MSVHPRFVDLKIFEISLFERTTSHDKSDTKFIEQGLEQFISFIVSVCPFSQTQTLLFLFLLFLSLCLSSIACIYPFYNLVSLCFYLLSRFSSIYAFSLTLISFIILFFLFFSFLFYQSFFQSLFTFPLSLVYLFLSLYSFSILSFSFRFGCFNLFLCGCFSLHSKHCEAFKNIMNKRGLAGSARDYFTIQL
jgi:hypothetical protein